MQLRTKAAFVLALAVGTTVSAQTATMPPHATIFNGNTRGYYFTAPVAFRITGVQVLLPPGSTNTVQNWAVVRFHNNTPPPPFAATTNAFDQLAFGLSDPVGSFIPVNIVIQPGDVIGVYGNTAASAAASTGSNSYTATGIQATTTILSNNVNLFRSGMQFHLGAVTSPQGMHDIWSEPASTAITRVEFTYAPLDPNAVGACCFNDGSCQFITYAQCETANGNFRGENVQCAAANCPQPGACCLNDGTCTFVLQSACATAGGTWTSAGTTCASANCPQPQACCLFDGTCITALPSICAGQGGASQGAGTQCATTTCPGIPPIFYQNCTLSTGAVTLNGVPAPAGGEWSECARDETDPTTANTTAGFGGSGALRLADDFVVPSGGLNLGYVKFPVYTTGATTLTVTGVTLQIWNGPPNVPGSQVIFGDMVTNRMAAREFSDIYRTFNTITPPTCGGALTPPGNTRRLQWAYATVNQFLPEGTYWLDWNYAGAAFSPPSTHASAIGRRCNPANSNAIQFNVSWVPANDAGQGCAPVPIQQDLYFELLGTPGNLCYPNCDGSTVEPILNIDDFTCFINEFAVGQTLPHPQQITHYSNCDQSTVAPVLNIDDFTCFINTFAQGCP